MRRSVLILITVVLVGLALFTVGASGTATPTSDVNIEGILKLHDGQVQKLMKDGEWICASAEVKDALGGYEGHDEIVGGYVTCIFGEYDPNTMTVEDTFIRQLAQSGRICEVMGHQWAPYLYEFALYRPDVVADQKCGLCGATRALTQTWSIE